MIDFIETAVGEDICYFCKKEIKATTRQEYKKKVKECKEKLRGNMCVKLNTNGEYQCICYEHINKLHDFIKSIEKEKVEEKVEEKIEEKIEEKEIKNKQESSKKKTKK